MRAAVLASVIALGACSEPAEAARGEGSVSAKEQRGLSVGDEAPSFSLRTLEGERVTLAEALRAGPVALIFGSYT